FRPVIDGQAVELLWTAPDFASGADANRSGIPLLFPFAGRLRGETMKFEGKEYPLPDHNRINSNAIHGFVLKQPWRVIETTPSRVVGQFQASRDDASLLKHWPADFCITVTYELSGTSLSCEIKIDKPDNKPLPFGL